MDRGVQVGLAGNKRRRQEKEDKKREEYEAAIRDAQMRQIEEIGTEELQGATEGAVRRTVQGGGVGPLGLNPEALAGEMQQVSPLERRVAQTKEIASRLSPQHRQQFIQEEHQRLQEQALTRARRSVMDGVQDRLATGAYTFEGDTEISPEIESRLQTLIEGLEADEIDPIQAQEIEAQVLGAVKKTSQQRLLKERGNGMVDRELQSAIQSGNGTYAGDLELLKAAWNTGEFDFDDLVDGMFESKHGRKTSRAAGPSALDLREKAIELSMKQEGSVSAESIERYLELLQPEQELTPGQVAENEQSYAAQVQAAYGENGRQAPGGENASLPDANASPAARGGSEADPGQKRTGGRPPASFKSLPKGRRTKIMARLKRAIVKGEDLAKVASSLDFDLESLPEAEEKALIRAAKGKKKD